MEPGQIDNHRASAAPHGHKHERRDDGVLPGKKHALRKAQAAQHRVEQAKLRIVQPLPKQRVSDRRNDRRKIKNRSKDRLPPDFVVEQQRQKESVKRRKDRRADRIAERSLNRRSKLAVAVRSLM